MESDRVKEKRIKKGRYMLGRCSRLGIRKRNAEVKGETKKESDRKERREQIERDRERSGVLKERTKGNPG